MRTNILANSHPASHPPFLGTRFYILKFLGPQSVRPQTGAEHGNSITYLHLQAPQGKERPRSFDGTARPCADLSFQPVAIDSTVDSPLAEWDHHWVNLLLALRRSQGAGAELWCIWYPRARSCMTEVGSAPSPPRLRHQLCCVLGEGL